jgi:hypothetical protein
MSIGVALAYPEELNRIEFSVHSVLNCTDALIKPRGSIKQHNHYALIY